MLLNTREDKLYVSVLSDGKLHMTVPEGTVGAVKREYETSDGKSGYKWEQVFTELSGIISGVSFFDGDFGKSIQIVITDGNEKPVVLSLATASNYGEDMMKKLLSIDINKPVKIIPYNFEDSNKKSKKGITIYQDGQKVKNYFYDDVSKMNTNGFPEPTSKTLSKEEWKMYFLQIRIFLINKITEHFGILNSKNNSNSDSNSDLEILVNEFKEDDDVPFSSAGSLTNEDKLIAINKMAKDKLGVVTDAEVKDKVMERLQIAFIPVNYNKISAALAAL